MALTLNRGSFRFLGLDLAAIGGYLRDGWSEAAQWRLFKKFAPVTPIRVIEANGRESVRRGVSADQLASNTKTSFVALELPDECVLRRSLVLPPLSNDELRQAVELDVRAASPFAEQELVWGYLVDRGQPERVRLDIALTSRKLVDAHLNERRSQLNGVRPEIWIAGAVPFTVPGYGESPRLALERKYRFGLLILLALASVLVIALVLTPTLQLRQRAIEAQSRSEELLRTVKTQVQIRDELAKLRDQLRLLNAAAQARVDVVALLNAVTVLLPDDVVLSRFDLSGSTVRISGQADNAAQLLQTLGASSAFRDVRAPSGIVRAPSAGKESFTIEFNLGSAPRPS